MKIIEYVSGLTDKNPDEIKKSYCPGDFGFAKYDKCTDYLDADGSMCQICWEQNINKDDMPKCCESCARNNQNDHNCWYCKRKPERKDLWIKKQ